MPSICKNSNFLKGFCRFLLFPWKMAFDKIKSGNKAKMLPKSLPDRLKILSEIDVKKDKFLHWFLIDFASQNGGQIHQKSSKNQSWSRLGSILELRWRQGRSQDSPRDPPRPHSESILDQIWTFWIDFAWSLKDLEWDSREVCLFVCVVCVRVVCGVCVCAISLLLAFCYLSVPAATIQYSIAMGLLLQLA